MEYKVVISLRAYLKFQEYIKQRNTEISGLGKVTKDKKTGTFYIEDLVLPVQTATAVSTTFNMGDFANDLIAQGGDTADYRLWWHSHVDMAVFWSGIDVATINGLDIEVPADNWFLSMVGNKKGEILCRLDIFDPIRLTMDNLPWEIDFHDDIITSQVGVEITESFKSSPLMLPFNKDKIKLHKPNGEDYNRYPQRDIIIP